MKIQKVFAAEVLDSRGTPTVSATVVLSDGSVGVANAPSGASTGKFEAHEKRDGDKKRYGGKGVQKAVAGVSETIAPVLEHIPRVTVQEVDRILIELDNTKNKEKLGANAMLAVSLAAAKALAAHYRQPLFRFLGGANARKMPVPMMNILNGGAHASNNIDIQEFMIMPVGAKRFSDAVRMGAEVYHALGGILKSRSLSVAVGDEGGFAPDLKDSDEALQLIVNAVQKAGYAPGNDVMIAIDAAASELYEESRNVYYFPGESRQCGKTVFRDTAEMVAYYEELIEKYPIVSIEDGLCEDDFEGWKQMTEALGNRVQLVGDDLFVTNVRRLSCGIALGTANAVLIKVNQIGTLSEALDAVEMAQRAGYRAVISHRSGETEDDFLADLAVATGAGQIKTGAPCRSERNAKYNELLRIEERLGEEAKYRNPFPQKGTGVREW